MNYTDLISDITSNVKPNGHREITGQVLQDVLLNMADYFERERLRLYPLTFEQLNSTGYFKLVYSTEATSASKTVSLEYSLNGGAWTPYTIGTQISTYKGDSLALRGTNAEWGWGTSTSNAAGMFDWSGTTGKWKVYGNIMSVFSEDFAEERNVNQTAILAYFFSNKYNDSSKVFKTLEDASMLILPDAMAYLGCFRMFRHCIGLKKAPTINGFTGGSQSAYEAMFFGCTALETAPELTATIVTASCYRQMFEGCTALKKSPVLKADDLHSLSCYASMFDGCTILNEVEIWATQNLYQQVNWLRNVAANGVFKKKAAATTFPSGPDGIPTGWSVVNIDE